MASDSTPERRVPTLALATGRGELPPTREVVDLLLDVANVGVLDADPAGRIVYANATADHLLSGTVGSVVGRNVDEFVPTSVHDHHRLRAGFAERSSTRSLSENRPLPAVTTDGGRLMLRIGLSPAPQLGAGHVLVVLVDVTDEVDAQRRIAEKVQLQQEAMDHLEEIEAHRIRLVDAAAHELRTPLTVILGFSELLDERGDELAADVLRRVRQRLRSQATSLASKIDDILSTAGQPQPAANLVAARLDESVAAHTSAWSDQGRDRTVQLTTAAVTAMIDDRTLRRILGVLLDNADLHGAPPIQVVVEASGDLAVVDVLDAGPGIPPRLQQEVFQPFSRGLVVDEAQPGLGLGLSIARLLARAAGGDLEARTRATGAHLRLTLPLTPDDDLPPLTTR